MQQVENTRFSVRTRSGGSSRLEWTGTGESSSSQFSTLIMDGVYKNSATSNLLNTSHVQGQQLLLTEMYCSHFAKRVTRKKSTSPIPMLHRRISQACWQGVNKHKIIIAPSNVVCNFRCGFFTPVTDGDATHVRRCYLQNDRCTSKKICPYGLQNP